MSQVAAAPKAAKSAAAPEAKGETLREVQIKRFPPSDFHHTGHDYEIMHVTAGSDWTFEDVLNPIAWSSVCRRVARDALNTRRDKLGSTIFVHAEHFFAMLNIDAVVLDALNNPCGLKVTCIGPMQNLETGEACPIDMKTKRPLVPSKSAKAAA